MTAAEQGERPAPSEGQGAGMGEIDLEAVKARWERVDGSFDHHVATVYPTHCDACVQRWPCDEADAREALADVPVLVAALESLRGQVVEARAAQGLTPMARIMVDHLMEHVAGCTECVALAVPLEPAL